MTRTTRLVTAALTPPVAAVVVVAFINVLVAVFVGAGWQMGFHSSFFILFFGVPIAYGVAAVVGIPSYFVLKRLDLLGLWPITAITSITGAVTLPWAWAGFWSGGMDTILAVVGVLPGVVSGVIFWAVGLRGVWDSTSAS
jgi:hypothetical protein